MMIAFRVFGWEAAVVSGLLVAVSPLHVRFSQEIRPYSIGFLALSAAIWALLEYRRTQARRWTFIWFIASMLAAYTLYFAALVALIVSVFVIVIERGGNMRQLWRATPQIVVAAAILYAPWWRVLLTAAREPPLAARDELTLAWVAYRLQVLATGDWRVEPIQAGSYIFWLLGIGGVIIAFRTNAGRTLIVWLIAGLAAELIILQFHPHPSAVRHLLPAWLAVFPLAGAAIAAISRIRGGPALAVLLCAVIIAADSKTIRAYYDHGRPDWRSVAQFVATRVRQAERVFAGNGWVELNFGYYWRQQGTPVPLERLPPNVAVTLSGPAWIITGSCMMDFSARQVLDRQELRFSSPYTNHSEVRYLPNGTTIVLPRSVCLNL